MSENKMERKIKVTKGHSYPKAFIDFAGCDLDITHGTCDSVSFFAYERLHAAFFDAREEVEAQDKTTAALNESRCVANPPSGGCEWAKRDTEYKERIKKLEAALEAEKASCQADDKHDCPTCKHGQDPDVPLRAGCLPCLTTPGKGAPGWEPIPVIEPPAPEPSEDDAQAVVDIERAGAAEAKEAEPKPKELRHMAFPKWCAKCARLNSETNACAYVCYFDPMRSSTPTQFLAMSKKEEPEEPAPDEEELRTDDSAWCPDCQNQKQGEQVKDSEGILWLNCGKTCVGGERVNGKVAKPGSFVLREERRTCATCRYNCPPSLSLKHNCTFWRKRDRRGKEDAGK